MKPIKRVLDTAGHAVGGTARKRVQPGEPATAIDRPVRS